MAFNRIPFPSLHGVQDADSDPKRDKGFKAAKDADRKASAGNRSAWNTLFMRPDTVAAAIAEHYGVSKAELLDRDASGNTAPWSAMPLKVACASFALPLLEIMADVHFAQLKSSL